jgi:two-component system, NtrC family, sensor histidine kinase KinB
MTFSLRTRVLVTLLPLLLLLIVIGVAAMLLLYRLGGRIDAILRENYDSVLAMERLNEALERIDSSFQFALAGQEEKAHQQYAPSWELYHESLRKEQNNITILPREQELVNQLVRLTKSYREQGDGFYAMPAARRSHAYFGPKGLLESFKEIKEVSADILRLNQDNMEDANREARQTVDDSLGWLGAGLGGAFLLAGLLAWRTTRDILNPLRSVTQSALAIGAGNLDQVVPVVAQDELGQLADAFNVMARQLRQYRQTDFARLWRAQQTSQATIDALPHPVLVVDVEGHVEMANPAARRVLGVAGGKESPSAVPWQPPLPLRQPLEDALRKQQSYVPEGFDHVVTIRSGSQDHFYLPRILPIQGPYRETLGGAVLLEDVTRFRLLDQVKSDLVATVSHELKTPLTGIRLVLHVLLEETIGPLTHKQTELLLDARDNAERLLGRINNLLDLARLEQEEVRLSLQPEAPAGLLQAAADAICPRAADKGIEVIVEASEALPAVAADAQRLRHALDNLLDNAVTYTAQGGHITLKATADGPHMLLTVADSGVGIPPEYLPRVFDRFFRVPGQSVEGGTGLGLAIVRETVEAHGGSIICESQPGAGTVFRMKLPLWTGQSGSTSAAPDGATANRSPHATREEAPSRGA